MAAKDRLDQLKSRIDQLRRDSLDVVANANRIVYQGIQKLADQELKALNEYYKSALASLKDTKKGDSIKDVAATQLDLMQDTVTRVISHARESLSIIADTRAELARLVAVGGPLSSKALTKVAEPAQKALEDVQKVVAKAQKSAAKTAKDVKKTLEKEIAYAEKKGKAAIKKGEAKAKEVGEAVKQQLDTVLDVAVPPALKKAVTAKPSPESRAARAVSKVKAKKAAVGGAAPKPATRSTMPPKPKAK